MVRPDTAGMRTPRLARPLALLLASLLVVACAAQAAPPSEATVEAVEPTPNAAAARPSPAPTEAAAAAAPAPTATPAPAPTATPTPWQSYTSKRFRYAMKYPPDWVVTPGSRSRPDRFDGFGPPNVFASRDTVAGTISVSRTVSSAVAYMKSHYKAKLKSNKSIRLRGWKGRILTFDATEGGVKYRVQTIILGKGRVAYFLEMWGLAENAKADAALFKKIYKTWRVKR